MTYHTYYPNITHDQPCFTPSLAKSGTTVIPAYSVYECIYIYIYIYIHLYIHMQYKYVCQRLFSSNKDQLATLSGCSCKCSEPRHHGGCVSLGCWRVHNCSMRCACLTCWQVWPLFAPAAEECGAPKMICTAGG